MKVALLWSVTALALFLTAWFENPLGMFVCLPIMYTGWTFGLRFGVVAAPFVEHGFQRFQPFALLDLPLVPLRTLALGQTTRQ